jgi:AcrR family transcriptional regulator
MAHRERHEETKQAILAGARALIVEKGVHALSLREVARRTGYSPASLYEYFSGKDDLVAAVAAEALERLGRYLDRVPTDLPPPERLVEIGLAYVAFARQNPEHFLLVFTRLPSARSSLQQAPGAGSPYRIVLQAAQAAIDGGCIAPQPGYGAEEIAYSVWVMAHGMAMLQQTHLRHFEADFPATDRRAFAVFIEGLKSR